MTGNESSSRSHSDWILAAIAVLIAVTAFFFLQGDANEAANQSREEQGSSEVGSQIELWRQELGDFRAQLEANSDIDLSQDLDTVEAQLQELTRLQGELEAGDEEDLERIQPTVESLMAEIDETIGDIQAQLEGTVELAD